MVVPAIAPDGFSGSGDAVRSERAIRWLHLGRSKDKCRSSTPLGVRWWRSAPIGRAASVSNNVATFGS